MPERILIAGCGDVGNALGRRLVAEGSEVWGVRRTPSALAAGIRPWLVDLTDPKSVAHPPAEFDALFYTASADRRDESSYQAIYVDAFRNLIAALRRTGSPLSRIFFTSSTAVYGQSGGEWVDEASDTEPARFNGNIVLEAEGVVRSEPGGVAVRLSGIYGPGRTRLIDKVWKGEATATPSWTNRIHVEDCGAALHHLLRLEGADDLYLGSDDAPVTTAEVTTWMSEHLGVEPPVRAEAKSLNKRCRNTRLVDSGYRFLYPTFREGYAPMLDAYLAQRADD